jgi:hypothetical protein
MPDVLGGGQQQAQQQADDADGDQQFDEGESGVSILSGAGTLAQSKDLVVARVKRHSGGRYWRFMTGE